MAERFSDCHRTPPSPTSPSHLEGALKGDQSKRLLSVPSQRCQKWKLRIGCQRQLSLSLRSRKMKGEKKNEEAALHVKPFIPTARDWLLAAPMAAESQPRVHVCGSVRARKCTEEEEAAHDCSLGHRQLLPVKVPLASLHCIRALNPREYTERRSEGGHPSSGMQRMKSFYSLPQCPTYRCNSLPLVTKMSCHPFRTAAAEFSPHTHR